MPFLLPINSAKSEKISGCANSRIKTLESYWTKLYSHYRPAIFLQDLFQFLLCFPFFIWSNLDFLITGWPVTLFKNTQNEKKKNLGFSNYLQKIWKLYKCNFFSLMIKLYKHASKPWNRLIVWTVAAVVWC